MANFRQLEVRSRQSPLYALSRLKPLLLATALSVTSGTASWADFNRGIAAFKKNDYRAAFQEWKSSADHGDPRSQQALGFMFLTGRGVLKDVAKAHFFFEIAAENFPPGRDRGRAIRLRDLTASRLSTDEHRQAHRLALKWLEGNKAKLDTAPRSEQRP